MPEYYWGFFQRGKSDREDGCCTNWPAPINALQQHRQLRGRQRHAAAGCLRPDKASLLQPFAKQAQAVAIPPQQFDPVTTPSAKGEDLTGEGIGFQLSLHHGRQTVEATTHVRDASGDPDTGSSGRGNHRTNCCKTSCSVCGSGAPVIRNLAFPTSTAISE